MFAKLKKKIENEGGVVPSSDFPGKSPGFRDSVMSLPQAGSIQQQGPSPPGSISGESTSTLAASLSNSEMATLLQRKSEQCKKLESSISELAALVKEKSKTIEKLEAALQLQEEVTQTNMDAKSVQRHEEGTWTAELSQWRQKEATLESEILKLREENRERAELVTSVSKDKAMLERKLGEMNKEVQEARSLLQEKDELVNSLQERVVTLEQRLSDTFLSGDDQHIALQVERDLMEQKLSETRLQMAEAKAALSDKVSYLERQITDLKNKLVDAEKTATENLNLASSEETRFREQIQELVNELSEQKLLAAEGDTHLRGRIMSLNLQLKDLEAARKLEREEAESKITMLEKQAAVVTDMEVRFQDKIKELEEDLKKLQKELSEKSTDIDSLRQQLQEQEIAGNDQHSTIKENELLKAELVQLSERIEEMSTTVASLETQLLEKNRVVKKQEQTLKDLRVTLQRELKVQALPNDESSDMTTSSSASNSRSRSHKFDTNLQPDLQQYHQQKQYLRQQNYHQPSIVHTDSTNSALPAVLSVQGSSLSNMVTLTAMSSSVPTSATDALMVHTSNVKRELDKDINFLYLKHVILKFMLSRESEALQLIKAVSMLLNFTHQEQQLIKDTLEYKMSWFGHRPPVGKGQTSKIIPPAL